MDRDCYTVVIPSQLCPIFNKNLSAAYDSATFPVNFYPPGDQSFLFQEIYSQDKHSTLAKFIAKFFTNNQIEFNRDEYDLYLSSGWVLNGEWLQIKGKNAIGRLDNLFVGEFFVGGEKKTINFKWVPKDSEPPQPVKKEKLKKLKK